MKHVSLVTVSLLLVCACASDDVADRRYGQHHVCHKGKTLAVTSGDLIVHQNHGDKIGPCPDEQ